MKLTGDLINYEMNKAGFNIPEVFEKNREYSLGDFYIGNISNAFAIIARKTRPYV